jgi:hypothetical protein
MAFVPSSSYVTYTNIMAGITPVTDIGNAIASAINVASADVTADLATIQSLVPLVSNPFLGGVGG